MASLKLILRTDKIDQTGEAPLFLRIIKDRKTKFLTLGVKLKLSEWDEGKQRIKKNHKNSERMNAFISTKVAEAQGEVADLSRKKKDVTARRLKDAIMGKKPENYFEYVYGRLDKLKTSLKYGVWQNYDSYTKKLEKFVGSKELLFEDITVSFLNDYKAWMINTRNNNPTTVAYTFRIMRKFTKEAISDGAAPASAFPYDKIVLTAPDPVKHFLTKAQVEELMKLPMRETTNAKIYRDMFVFCCFAGGLRFSDVLELTWENYVEAENRIVKTIRKSGRSHNFKIGSIATEILQIYKTPDAKQTDYIFPILAAEAEYAGHGHSHFLIKSNLSRCANLQLHKLGKELKLPFTLTFHASRHTFATNALKNGMRIEYVSKLMDHASIGITQMYAKIVNEDLDEAVEKYLN
jgi:integrase